MITDKDLRNMKALSQCLLDTDWLRFGSNSLVCGLDKVVIFAMTREECEAMISEILDHRARVGAVEKEG